MKNKSEFLDLRAADPSFLKRWQQETQLCTVIESPLATPEEKYQALIELAHLSGILVREPLADAA